MLRIKKGIINPAMSRSDLGARLSKGNSSGRKAKDQARPNIIAQSRFHRNTRLNSCDPLVSVAFVEVRL